jgi:hypothetical protein
MCNIAMGWCHYGFNYQPTSEQKGWRWALNKVMRRLNIKLSLEGQDLVVLCIAMHQGDHAMIVGLFG